MVYSSADTLVKNRDFFVQSQKQDLNILTLNLCKENGSEKIYEQVGTYLHGEIASTVVYTIW